MAVSDPGEYQKEEAYATLLGVTVRSLRAAFPFLIVGRACQLHYLGSHIPLKSFQWAEFKVWNSGRSCMRPPAAVPVYKPRSALLCWPLWYRLLGQLHPMEGSQVGGEKNSILHQKTEIKIIHIGPVQEYPMQLCLFFFSPECGFDLKQTQCRSQNPNVHMSVFQRSELACAALDCVTFSHLVSSHCSASWRAESGASSPDYCP